MGVEPKNRGKTSQIMNLFIGFSIINYQPSILGVKSPYFWFNTHIMKVNVQKHMHKLVGRCSLPTWRASYIEEDIFESSYIKDVSIKR